MHIDNVSFEQALERDARRFLGLDAGDGRAGRRPQRIIVADFPLITEVNEHYWRYASIDKNARDTAIEEWNQPIRWPIYLLLAAVAALFAVGLRKRKEVA